MASSTSAMTDFQFAFDPTLFPDPPAVPPSSELFSASEADNIFGFLDNFNDWDFDGDLFGRLAQQNIMPPPLPSQDTYIGGFPELAGNALSKPDMSPPSSVSTEVSSQPLARHQPHRRKRSPSSSAHSPDSPSSTRRASISSMNGPGRTRPLLDDKQKRMNHIMSEQKRRNAIRDGYAQLTTLLAPAGAPPGTLMPTRGRPKGSGAKGKGRPSAGKSGVLLRAVEYCRWLEEGRDALLEEVKRLEAASGVRVDL
ncbi:uncharacterized protein FOMMEDRAFT_23915 [Fomitiporia mediterranea MF3/22]|uniref:uncharacterized protein n=1 Tax=Fomitiporia mediterranea (strain MF3/22) TaxID=694068 RepID=UPI0004408AA9|nr:uncharacterized protein FOMMEDRAFT_23915 [Fomitiporia mediterranea MF3/22]EJC97843.1 hypothetical protein FOMMEDRAFT_23915 [Fomitiporia mediterranea MF3/22]